MNASEPNTSVRLKWVAAFIPVVCVALLMVRGEVRTAGATKFLVPIYGYDPRDLLHGQYIRFRFEWNEDESLSSCGGTDCCLCLRGAEMSTPRVHQIDCLDTSETCDATISAKQALANQRYLVPEHSGVSIEDALRESDASVEVQCSSDQEFALGALYLDGQPWRAVID
jgi:uncharacterized membrane-anchored protein